MEENKLKDDLQYAIDIIVGHCRTGFYGKIEVHYKDGKIVDVKKVEDLKPPSFYKK